MVIGCGNTSNNKGLVDIHPALRQKDQQLSLVEETEAFLRSALTRAEEKIEEDEREIEHLRAQIEKLRRMLFGTRSEKLRREVELAEALLKQREHVREITLDASVYQQKSVTIVELMGRHAAPRHRHQRQVPDDPALKLMFTFPACPRLVVTRMTPLG